MKYSFSEDKSKLIITVDPVEQEMLNCWDVMSEHLLTTNAALNDFFESLVCNSELDWVNPEDTGDLTDAPMLGILGEERPERAGELIPRREVGFWNDRIHVEPILGRWAFMDYCVRSPLEDLRDKGEAVFVGGMFDCSESSN